MATLDWGKQDLARYVVDWAALSPSTQTGVPPKPKPSFLSHLSVVRRHW